MKSKFDESIMDEILPTDLETAITGSSVEIHDTSLGKYGHSLEQIVSNGMVIEEPRLSKEIRERDNGQTSASVHGNSHTGTPNEPNISLPPDGGYAWVVAISALLLNTFGWGANSGYGVFLSNFLSSNRYPDANDIDFAFIGGITFGTAFLCSPVVTLALGKFHVRTVILAGSIIQAASLVIASFTTKIYQLYLSQGVMQGIGLGFLFLPANVLIPQWFYKRRGIANGIATSGAGVGGVIFSLIIQAFIDHYGIAWAQRSIAIIAFTMNVLAAFLMRTRDSSIKPVVKMFDKSLFWRYEVILLLVWATLGMYGYVIFLFSMSSYSVAMGLTHAQGAIVGACLNVGMIIGRPTVGFLMDLWGHYNVILGCTGISIILSFGMWIPATSYATIIALAFLIGLVVSIVSVGLTPLAAELVDLKHLPAMFSMTWLAVGVGLIFAEPIALVLRKPHLSDPYIYCQIFTGLSFVVSALCLIVVREVQVRNILNSRRNQKLAEVQAVRDIVSKIDPDSKETYDQENQVNIPPIPGYFHRLICIVKV